MQIYKIYTKNKNLVLRITKLTLIVKKKLQFGKNWTKKFKLKTIYKRVFLKKTFFNT